MIRFRYRFHGVIREIEESQFWKLVHGEGWQVFRVHQSSSGTVYVLDR